MDSNRNVQTVGAGQSRPATAAGAPKLLDRVRQAIARSITVGERSVRTYLPSGPGNSSFRHLECVRIRNGDGRPASTCTNRSCRRPSHMRRERPASRSVSAHTPSGTRSRRTCSRAGTIFGPCRSCLAMRTSARRWCTRTCSIVVRSPCAAPSTGSDVARTRLAANGGGQSCPAAVRQSPRSRRSSAGWPLRGDDPMSVIGREGCVQSPARRQSLCVARWKVDCFRLRTRWHKPDLHYATLDRNRLASCSPPASIRDPAGRPTAVSWRSGPGRKIACLSWSSALRNRKPGKSHHETSARCDQIGPQMDVCSSFSNSIRVGREPANHQMEPSRHTSSTIMSPRCRFSKPRDPFLTTFSKPFPPLG